LFYTLPNKHSLSASGEIYFELAVTLHFDLQNTNGTSVKNKASSELTTYQQ